MRTLFLAFALFAGCSSAPASPQDRAPAPAGSAVPTPESVIGHPVGSRAVAYDDLVRYLHALADASEHVTLQAHGTTHEGRTLYHLTITSAANHARLEAIRQSNLRLADPRNLSDPDAEAIVRDMPGVAWLAYSIHGDEMSPCDAAMVIAHRLATGTDDATRRLRDELVVHIDPLMNPDGRQRYLDQLRALTGKVPSTDTQALEHSGLWSAGRGNHYLFDMNRDWFALSQPESRGRVAAIRRWNPHLVVDAHEMGALDTYLFDPPNDPINANIAPSVMKWRRAMSKDQAAGQDRFGWSYYTREWYDEWYAGYTGAWASLRGAAGLLYEAAGVNGGSVRRPSGEHYSYADAVAQNVASSMSNLETLRANRREILADFLADRRAAVAEDGAGWFVIPAHDDAAAMHAIEDMLAMQGIELLHAAEPFSAAGATDAWGDRHESMELPAGSIAIPLRQPLRRFVNAILELDPRLPDHFLRKEREDLERGDGSRMYDVSAWNPVLAAGLELLHADAVEGLQGRPGPMNPRSAIAAPAGRVYGWLIDGASSDIHAAAVRLMDAGCTLRAASKPFASGGRAYAPGTILLRGHENPDDLHERVLAAADGLRLDIAAIDSALAEDGPDLGGPRFHLLHAPRVALATQWPVSATSFGSIWHLLDDQVRLRVSPIGLTSLGYTDLRKYNVIVLPAAGRLDAILDGGARAGLRDWIEAGGTLVAVDDSAAALASADAGLSQVRRKRDVLDDLEVYDEAVAQERAARHVTIDPALVWGDVEPEAEVTNEDDGSTANAGVAYPPKGDDRERADRRARLFSSVGTIARADTDDRHWLCFGLGDRLPVLVSGSTALMAKPPVETALRLADASDIRVSGLLWPEARARWSNTAWCTRERVGNGQVILLAGDPAFRGYWNGTARVLKNAVVFGPGMGSDQPVPW